MKHKITLKTKGKNNEKKKKINICFQSLKLQEFLVDNIKLALLEMQMVTFCVE